MRFTAFTYHFQTTASKLATVQLCITENLEQLASGQKGDVHTRFLRPCTPFIWTFLRKRWILPGILKINLFTKMVGSVGIPFSEMWWITKLMNIFLEVSELLHYLLSMYSILAADTGQFPVVSRPNTQESNFRMGMPCEGKTRTSCEWTSLGNSTFLAYMSALLR